MTSPAIKWTAELSAAAKALGATVCPMGGTIPERAREMAFMRPGATLTPMQLDCVAMLRSRMHSDTPEELAFNAAWSAAWNAATVAPEARFDRACAPQPGRHGDIGPDAPVMPRPDHTAAMDYALGVETSWGLTHSVMSARAEDFTDCGTDCVRVRTFSRAGELQNDWSVWIEPDGTLYGEC